jgi:hypothetical protein
VHVVFIVVLAPGRVGKTTTTTTTKKKKKKSR